MCRVATGLHLTRLGPTQQVKVLAVDILTDTEVMSTWPTFLF